MHDPMTDDARQMLCETRESRAQAAALLEELLEARRLSEQNLASIKQPDLVKKVTGRSSLDNAIESTRRLIASYDRLIADLDRPAETPAVVGVVGLCPARVPARVRG
jgi:Uncharacterized protein conserved in bacteria